jgi:hypothetical protein
MKFLRNKAKNTVQEENDPHIWVRKKNRNAHKKYTKFGGEKKERTQPH